MADPAGRLQIRIAASGTTIASSRPLKAAKMLVGRDPAQTARLVPALFSICAIAQSAACAQALEQAQGLEPEPARVGLRDRLVAAETLREHLWRMLLDWPRLLGLDPDVETMAGVMECYAQLRGELTRGQDPFQPGPSVVGPGEGAASRPARRLQDLVRDRILGVTPELWLESVQGLGSLATWSEQTETVPARLLRRLLAQDRGDLGRCAVRPLPEPDPVELDERLASAGADAFVARPTWAGEPRETSPLTRHLHAVLIQDLATGFGNGLLTRLAAQLLELASLAQGGRLSGGIPARLSCEGSLGALRPGVGLAQVPAARGRLVHRVELRDGRVSDYRILAPTEWNFHPQGVVAAGLDAIAARVVGPELDPLARLFVAAVDPCVDFDLEWA